MVSIARPHEVTLNGLKYLLDESGKLMLFEDEESAKEFLRDNMIPEALIEECTFPNEAD